MGAVTSLLTALLVVAAILLGGISAMNILAGGALVQIAAIGHLIESMILFSLVMLVSQLREVFVSLEHAKEVQLKTAQIHERIMQDQQQALKDIAKLLTEQAQYLSDIAAKD